MDDAPSSNGSSPADPPVVLVVDDERGLADLYAAWLSRDYDTRVAYDGEQALERIDADVNVALLDRRMPETTGDDVLEVIRSRDIDCATAMVTAAEPDFDILELEFDDYLTKPVSQVELLGLVERLVKFREYDELVSELFRLLNKKSLLQAQKSQGELDRHEAYQTLLGRIEAVKHETDKALSELQTTDSEGTFFRYLENCSSESDDQGSRV